MENSLNGSITQISKNIQHLVDGGFGKIYKAIWNAGRIENEYNEIKKITLEVGHKKYTD